MNVETAHRPFSAAASALALALTALVNTVAWPLGAAEPAEVTVTRSRVVLEDVMPGCPPSACKTDLGPAPPPLSSWLVDASVIRNALESAGEDRRALRDVQSVRVLSAGRVLGPAEAAEFARPSIESALPAGVTLVGVQAKSKLTLPLLATAGAATLPKLPKRAGPVTTTAMVDVLLDGLASRRVPILVRLTISASAARADVPRGQSLELVIERGSATISMSGIALRDTAIGEVGAFKVQRTGRVINALVKSAGVAQVQEGD
jgi:hypothetical protein